MTPDPLLLEDKLRQFLFLARVARWPVDMVDRGTVKIIAGHQEHGDATADTPRCASEGIEEALDLGGGYPAIARCQGRWHWAWWIVVALSGIQGRVLLWLERGRE